MNKNGNGKEGLAISESSLQVLNAISGRAALAAALVQGRNEKSAESRFKLSDF